MKKIISSLLCASSIVFAQISTGSHTPIPRQQLFQAFFGHVSFMDSKAEQAKSNGQSGIEFKNYYKDTIGLTEKESAALIEIAKECEQALAVENEKSRIFIESNNLLFKQKQILTSEEISNIQYHANILASERQSAIDLKINLLSAKMGITSFSKLENFIQTTFALNVSSTPVPNILPQN